MEDDRDSLPEWCLEDAEEEMGTFDSSGAFLSLKVKSCLGRFVHLQQMFSYVRWIMDDCVDFVEGAEGANP